MILLTVGTIFPFDRLVKAVDEAVGAGIVPLTVVAQIGRTPYRPQNMEWREAYDKDDFDCLVQQCQAMIGHAGTGTITSALSCNKPLLVVPRLAKFGEAVNDHQVMTAQKYEAQGCILAAYDMAGVPGKMQQLMKFKVQPRTGRAGPIVARIRGFLETVQQAG